MYNIPHIDPVMILPFIILLGLIAFAPFINKKFWENYYPAISISLGLIIVGYYIFILKNSEKVLITAHDYFSFIILIGSLYVVSGGILILLKGKSTPKYNLVLLAIGAVVANILGTTGASMLLIRPFIKINKYRLKPFHIIFFIFIVSNVGGMLTPIGDPPLFLGFLKGIPFFWITTHLFWIWLFTNGLILAIFYLYDKKDFEHRTEKTQHEIESEKEEWHFKGILNLGFLALIIFSVFIESPIMLREIIMITAALSSYYFTDKEIHKKNNFNFHPIKEVAILFLGIFATMMPALDWLSLNSSQLGINTTTEYFWATGLLSSALDNAPTYLNFLTASFGLFNLNIDNVNHLKEFLINHAKYVEVISAASVTFGACTYIGNGPNFMVKSIAEQSGVEMPNFVEYIFKFSLKILLPIYFLVWLIFF